MPTASKKAASMTEILVRKKSMFSMDYVMKGDIKSMPIFLVKRN
jgi:hypothetical protein